LRNGPQYATTGYAPHSCCRSQWRSTHNPSLSCSKRVEPRLEERLRQAVRRPHARDASTIRRHVSAIVAVRAIIPEDHLRECDAALVLQGREVGAALVPRVCASARRAHRMSRSVVRCGLMRQLCHVARSCVPGSAQICRKSTSPPTVLSAALTMRTSRQRLAHAGSVVDEATATLMLLRAGSVMSRRSTVSAPGKSLTTSEPARTPPAVASYVVGAARSSNISGDQRQASRSKISSLGTRDMGVRRGAQRAREWRAASGGAVLARTLGVSKSGPGHQRLRPDSPSLRHLSLALPVVRSQVHMRQTRGVLFSTALPLGSSIRLTIPVGLTWRAPPS
jgi:hypothetical protein